MTGPVVAAAAAVVKTKRMLEGVIEVVTDELVRFPRVDCFGVVETATNAAVIAIASLVGIGRARRGEEPAGDGIDRVRQLKCPVIFTAAGAAARNKVAPGTLGEIAPCCTTTTITTALDGGGTAVNGTWMIVASVPDLR